VIRGQLALDLDARHDEDDLRARLRGLVVEDAMSEEEAAAAIEDAIRQIGDTPAQAEPAKPCACTSPMVFVAALAEDRRCARCGREPGS
jgi:hypothetical protein